MDDYSVHSSQGENYYIVKIYHPRRLQNLANVSQYANDLRCVHCNKQNTALNWPRNGDAVAFYYNTKKEVEERPGAYRVLIHCPHCGNDWFVVWDFDPS
jgi:transcription elongation factor Elf1